MLPEVECFGPYKGFLLKLDLKNHSLKTIGLKHYPWRILLRLSANEEMFVSHKQLTRICGWNYIQNAHVLMHGRMHPNPVKINGFWIYLELLIHQDIFYSLVGWVVVADMHKKKSCLGVPTHWPYSTAILQRTPNLVSYVSCHTVSSSWSLGLQRLCLRPSLNLRVEW